MQLSPSQIKTIRHQFDALCRKVLREESRNIEKIRLRRLEREICFTGLSEYERKKLLVTDEYSFESTYFQVMDQSISIKDDRLAEAIESLAKEKQQIILLSYFFDMTDQEIAEVLHSFRSTVQRKKTHSIMELRIKLEVKVNSCASLLLKNGVPMKQIQEWLGHSDFSTTANIYAHLDCSSKLISADAMLNGLGMDSK